MSRLCRLRTKSHGEDGQWAYDEIVSQRKQIEALTAQVGVLKEALNSITDVFANIGMTSGIYDDEQDALKAACDALATTPESALSEVRKAERERVAKMILNGRFLHDQAPTALFAKEVAAAIRAMGDE